MRTHRAIRTALAMALLTLLPDFPLSAARTRAPYKHKAHLDLYIEGLRKAGLPE